MRLAHLFACLVFFVGSLSVALFYKFKPFPYELLVASAGRIFGESTTTSRCPVVYDKKLYRTRDISNEGKQIKNIFWGDSRWYQTCTMVGFTAWKVIKKSVLVVKSFIAHFRKCSHC